MCFGSKIPRVGQGDIHRASGPQLTHSLSLVIQGELSGWPAEQDCSLKPYPTITVAFYPRQHRGKQASNTHPADCSGRDIAPLPIWRKAS